MRVVVTNDDGWGAWDCWAWLGMRPVLAWR